MEGKFLKVQIKSHQYINIDDRDFITENLSKSYLRYCYECRIPIILIVVSTSTHQSWFVWIQKWIIDSGNIANIYNEIETKSLGVNIYLQNDFVSGLKHDLIAISKWENSTQKYIAVRDLANLSLKLYDDKLAQILFAYLKEFDPQNVADADYLDALIDKVIILGLNIWGTSEGNQTSQQLFQFIREYGDKLNTDHISKLIIRGDQCSRTGINALGVLYDNYPSHAISLNLSKKFENFVDPRLHYYCVIKERALKSKKHWLSEENDLKVGNLYSDFSTINTSIYDKWANRGDSVIFDYIFEIEK